MNTAAFLARYEGLKGRLPGDSVVRASAARGFARLGIPDRRLEAWKYTNLRALEKFDFHEPLRAVGDECPLLRQLPDLTGQRIVLIDGRVQSGLSRVGPQIQLRDFAHRAEFGGLAQPEREALVGLNTMLAEDGAVISVEAGVDAGVLLLASLASDIHGKPVTFHPRHIIRLAPAAKLTILEMSLGEGVYLHNPVTEIAVAEGAALTHVRLQDEAPGAFHLSTLYADVAAGGTYDSFALTLGALLARNEMHVRLGGAHAMAHLNAAQVLRGRQHADFTTVVSHDAPHCASRQTVRNVLDGHARGVFQGRIEVARGAQKTDGYQMNKALLLSPDAEIDCKPELEIYADDVKCSHGATVGALDEDQLFYLRSRGVPHADARAMLVRAFLTDALDGIADADIKAVLEASIERWWMKQS
jgi:Fe-S cluster assembly protein SufD